MTAAAPVGDPHLQVVSGLLRLVESSVCCPRGILPTPESVPVTLPTYSSSSRDSQNSSGLGTVPFVVLVSELRYFCSVPPRPCAEMPAPDLESPPSSLPSRRLFPRSSSHSAEVIFQAGGHVCCIPRLRSRTVREHLTRHAVGPDTFCFLWWS